MAQALNEYQETGKLSDEMKKQLDELDYEDFFSAMQNQAPVEADDLTEEEMNAIQNYVGGERTVRCLDGLGWADS